jgi:hypothetical protein
VVLWIFVLQLFLSTGSNLPRPVSGGGQESGEQNGGVEPIDDQRNRGNSPAAPPPVKTTIS